MNLVNHFMNVVNHFSKRMAVCGAAAVLATGGVTWGAVQADASTGPRTCATGDLYLSMGRKEAAAGSLYWPVRMTNTSTSTCALRGYPGVSVLNTSHRQIGAAASRTGAKYGRVDVAPGRTVTAVVRTANGPVGGPCNPTGTYLRIYPPASYEAVLVPAALRTCSGVFSVGPVTARTAF
ncbi:MULTISPECIES: DUF4232 domain-containing protein [unclassified Streptomyces]|uniref:DUF4232 domain-containing protein n=1 Tax=unclassified Streptomyces TaxID=2593676 RepID=UPI0027424636|nr:MULTISPECIES: DUF4232 domain-containing protein [unclassified Streptomyces]